MTQLGEKATQKDGRVIEDRPGHCHGCCEAKIAKSDHFLECRGEGKNSARRKLEPHKAGRKQKKIS